MLCHSVLGTLGVVTFGVELIRCCDFRCWFGVTSPVFWFGVVPVGDEFMSVWECRRRVNQAVVVLVGHR